MRNKGRMSSGLQPGSLASRAYAVIAEFPGVRVTSAEVAVELGISSHLAGTYLYTLHGRGYIKKSGGGKRWQPCEFWVEP